MLQIMDPIKRCKRCFKTISNIYDADLYSHMSIKYCPECREIVRKEQARERINRLRARQREAAKLKDDRIRQLEMENEILRQKFEKMWEHNKVV